jgi:multiple sugar transport system substrate-binding protein
MNAETNDPRFSIRLTRRSFLRHAATLAGAAAATPLLAACGGPAQPTTAPTAAAPAAAKAASAAKDPPYDLAANIVYWGESGERWEWPERGELPLFNKVWPNIKVEVYAGPIGEMLGKIQVALASMTDKYDVISQDYSYVAMNIAGNQLESLQPYIDRDPAWRDQLYSDIPEKILDTYRDKPLKQGGKLYGIPPDGNTQVMFYRKDVLEKAGITPPKTWPDCVAAAKALTGGDQYGFTGPFRRGPWSAQNFLNWYWSYGGTFFGSEDWANMKPDDWKINIHDDACAQALGIAKEIIKYAAPGTMNAVDDEANALIANGTVVLAPAMTAGSVLTSPKTCKFAAVMGSAVPPAGTGPKGTPAPATLGLGLVIPTNCKNKEAAWAFIKFMNSGDIFVAPNGEQLPFGKTWVDSFGQPARMSLLTKYASVQSYYPALADALKVSHRFWPIAENGALLDMLGTQFSSFLTGDLTDSQFMNEVERAGNDIMKQAGYFK